VKRDAEGEAPGDSALPPPSGTPAVPAPPVAATVFGSALPLAERFVAHLADTGISWGLVGPREVPRLWDRHVLNCAVLTDLIAPDARVIDIGSGAGLPGLTIALRRPDLQVVLVEPLLRRAHWLELVFLDLGLANVTVRRARAEELHGQEHGDYVTARAVASLDRLARWGLPLLRPHGELLALKGQSAAEEVSRTACAVSAAGGVSTDVVTVGGAFVDPPVTVVRVRTGAEGAGTEKPAGCSARRRGGPRSRRRPPAG
jgi:16S rRNA (guanine527-N7)-methyltransferase